MKCILLQFIEIVHQLGKMWKCLIIILLLVSLCYCEKHSHHVIYKKKHHYKDPFKHLLYGGGILYYLGFIIIKIKVAFILGTIFTVFLIGGKLFALVKYLESAKTKHDDHHVEKIYMSPPDHFSGPDHESKISFGPPPSFSGYSNSYSPSYGQSFSPGFSVDKLPPNAEISQQGYNSPPPGWQGREIRDIKYTLWNYYEKFLKFINRANITEKSFKMMNITSESCKKKFICKADYNAQFSVLLKQGLELLSDKNYEKYKTNTPIGGLDDCDELYEDCTNDNF